MRAVGPQRNDAMQWQHAIDTQANVTTVGLADKSDRHSQRPADTVIATTLDNQFSAAGGGVGGGKRGGVHEEKPRANRKSLNSCIGVAVCAN